MKSNHSAAAIGFWAIAAGLLLSGCGASTVFLDRSFDFNYIERVAVIPFENLSQTQSAGRQATLILLTELLNREAFAVVEPGETAKVLGEISSRSGALDLEQIKEVGKKLEVQALIFGAVSETSTIRSGGLAVPTVTVDMRLVETETGGTVWSASRSEGRPGLLASLFGLGSKSSSETMRDCISHMVKSLIK